MATDDLLLTTGVDLSGLKEAERVILSTFTDLATDIRNALGRADLLPNLRPQGVRAGAQLVQGLSDATGRISAGVLGAKDLIPDLTPQGARAGKQLATGLATAATQTEGLRAAQQRWIQEAQGGSVAAQGAYQRMRNEIIATANATKQAGASAASAAQQEIAARAQVRSELAGEIRGLSLYGRTVDATSAAAVAGWRADAAAIRQQAREVGLTREQMLRLDLTVQQVEQRFARLARTPVLPNLAGNVAGAATSLGLLNAQTGRWSAVGNRGASAAVAFGFGLEGLVRGGAAAESGVRQALRAASSFALFLGPTGAIAGAVGLTIAAVLDLFNKARDEMRKTQKAFSDSLAQMVNAADIVGQLKTLQTIDIGLPSAGQGIGGLNVFKDGLIDLQARAGIARTAIALLTKEADKFRQFDAKTGTPLRVPLDNVIDQNKTALRAMDAQITELKRQRAIIDQQIRNPVEIPPPPQLSKNIVVGSGNITKETKADLDALSRSVQNVINLEKEAAARGFRIPGIPKEELEVFDRLTIAVRKYGDGTDEAAVRVRALQTELNSLSGVIVEVERRKFPNIGDIPPVEVRGKIVDITSVPQAKDIAISLLGAITTIRIPPPVRALAKAQLAFKDLPPIEPIIDPQFDTSGITLGLKNAIKDATDATSALGFANILGKPEAIRAASDVAADATANLREEAEKARLVIEASAGTDLQKIATLEKLRAFLAGLGIDFNVASRGAVKLANTLSDIGSVTQGILAVGDAVGGLGPKAEGALRGVLSLLDGVRTLSASTTTLGSLGAGLGILGAAFTTIQALRGSGNTETATDKLIKELNQRLSDLKVELRDFNPTAGNLAQVSRALIDPTVLAAARPTIEFTGGGRGVKIPRPSIDEDAINEALRSFGLTLADVEKVARDQGIQLRDSHGKILIGAFDAVSKQLGLTALSLTRFRNNLEDFQFVASARADIFDRKDSPQAAFGDAVASVKQFTGGLNVGLEGLDIANKEQRAAAKAEIRRLFELAVAGKLTADQLKGLTVREFVSLLRSADDALDDLASSAKAAAGELVNVVSGFRNFSIDRAKFLATEPSAIRVITPVVKPSGTVPVSIGTGGGTTGTKGPKGGTIPTPAPVPIGAMQTIINVDQVIINGSEFGPETWYEGVRSVVTRKAKASANPEVKRNATMWPT